MGDKWVKDDRMFICDGQGYVISPRGQTLCVGPVDDDGNVLEDVYNTPETSPSAKKDVIFQQRAAGASQCGL